jgi:integrase
LRSNFSDEQVERSSQYIVAIYQNQSSAPAKVPKRLRCMHTFRNSKMMKNYSPQKAAERAVHLNLALGLSRHQHPALARTKVTSVMTADAHCSALTQFSKHLACESNKHLKNASPSDAKLYLEKISLTKKQSTVSLARQAINLHLLPHQPIKHVVSCIATKPLNRAYTTVQINFLCEMASPTLALSIAIACSAGLRVMELLSISDTDQQRVSHRDWHVNRFLGREHYPKFIVHGKGGLCREIRITPELALRLADMKRQVPVYVSNRHAHLQSYFDLMGGHDFSIQFSKLSKRILGFSHGAHGLRHSYAQQRLHELLCIGLTIDEAIQVVSQEMGHFAIKNTMAYLRDQVA